MHNLIKLETSLFLSIHQLETTVREAELNSVDHGNEFYLANVDSWKEATLVTDITPQGEC